MTAPELFDDLPFNLFSDSAPDTWRIAKEREEREQAEREQSERQTTLFEQSCNTI
jgi:hypothetical protein